MQAELQVAKTLVPRPAAPGFPSAFCVCFSLLMLPLSLLSLPLFPVSAFLCVCFLCLCFLCICPLPLCFDSYICTAVGVLLLVLSGSQTSLLDTQQAATIAALAKKTFAENLQSDCSKSVQWLQLARLLCAQLDSDSLSELGIAQFIWDQLYFRRPAPTGN